MRLYLNVGHMVDMRMPYSEVCMSMKVAGKVMIVELVRNDNGHVMAQLHEPLGGEFSAPITPAEAGVFKDEDGYYVHRDS